MKHFFSGLSARLSTVLLALVLAGAFATGCSEDKALPPVPNYATIDDAIIRKYIADNNITNAQKTASGLYFVPVTTNPTGAQAVAGKTASVLYTGKLMDGTIFDSSAKNNNVPFSFVVGAGKVIAGWDEGIALMRKGEKAQLLIPSALAYGVQGAGTSIPPNTVIRFDVEVTDVK